MAHPHHRISPRRHIIEPNRSTHQGQRVVITRGRSSCSANSLAPVRSTKKEKCRMIALRPMTQEEYEPYMRFLRDDYARERAKSSDTPLEEERIESDRQIANLLPDGLQSAGHRLWSVVEADGNEVVGSLWVFVDDGKKRAFIYDIAIREARRGKGYGRHALELLEDELRPLGV